MKDGMLRRHYWVIPIEAAMLVGAALTFADKNWVHFGLSVFMFLGCFAPLLFEKVTKVKLTTTIQLIFAGFIFLSMFCGEVLYLYRDVWWWDAAAHGVSGVLIALGFLLWIRRLATLKHIRFSSWYQTFFVIACGMMAATVWELVEFGADELFGARSQDGSLRDTMTDLLYGSAGTMLLAIIYEWHERRSKLRWLERIIAGYERLNRYS